MEIAWLVVFLVVVVIAIGITGSGHRTEERTEEVTELQTRTTRYFLVVQKLKRVRYDLYVGEDTHELEVSGLEEAQQQARAFDCTGLQGKQLFVGTEVPIP